MCSLSVVIPVFNEQESLVKLFEETRSALSSIDETVEIIFVDDHSVDSSFDVLARLLDHSTEKLHVRVIRLRRNYGQTAAMAAGFDAARGRVVVPMDADLQNNPADIPRLISKLDEGFDVVSGWRRKRRDNALSRRFPSFVANWLIGIVTGVKLHDYGCTLKAYRASVLQELHLYGEMHRFIPVYLARLGARTTEVEVDHRPRTTGSSKYGLERLVKVVLDLVLVRFFSHYYSRPMHFFGQTAFAFAGLAVAIFGMMLTFKYGWLGFLGINYKASFVETPLPALAVSLIVGSMLALFFGVLGEILIRVHHESSGVKPYSVDRILESPRDG